MAHAVRCSQFEEVQRTREEHIAALYRKQVPAFVPPRRRGWRGKEGGREGGSEGAREGAREGGRERGGEGGREGGSEGGREGGREREVQVRVRGARTLLAPHVVCLAGRERPPADTRAAVPTPIRTDVRVCSCMRRVHDGRRRPLEWPCVGSTVSGTSGSTLEAPRPNMCPAGTICPALTQDACSGQSDLFVLHQTSSLKGHRIPWDPVGSGNLQTRAGRVCD